MARTVNVQQIQIHTSVNSVAYLKGILKVLTDMHLKDSPNSYIEKYKKELEEELANYREDIYEASKP